VGTSWRWCRNDASLGWALEGEEVAKSGQDGEGVVGYPGRSKSADVSAFQSNIRQGEALEGSRQNGRRPRTGPGRSRRVRRTADGGRRKLERREPTPSLRGAISGMGGRKDVRPKPPPRGVTAQPGKRLLESPAVSVWLQRAFRYCLLDGEAFASAELDGEIEGENPFAPSSYRLAAA